MEKTTLIFDWGDTIMRDFVLPGKMKDWDIVEWIPGAEEMLRKVGQQFLCCIATSANRSDTNDMIAALQRVGAEKYFQQFFSSADLGFIKPDPGFFNTIIERLGVNAEECISIGNLYLKDIVPAKAAGLSTVWFNENKKPGNYPDADFIINSLDELPAILEKIK